MAVERKLVQENKRRLLMREFLARESARAGFGGCEIKRTPLGLRIRLVAERPGFVIGRRGSTIQRITKELAEMFDLDDPQIEVEEAENPDLNAQIAAQKMAEALERGWHFRRAGHSTVRRIMNSGAKGCQIILTGKLTGSRGRMEKFTAGHIKHCGEPAEEFMREGYAMAKKKLGTIGVQVKIMAPDAKLPDDVTVLDTDERPSSAVQIHEEYVESQAEAQEALDEIEEEAPLGADEDVPESAGPGLEEEEVEPEAEAEPDEEPEAEPEAEVEEEDEEEPEAAEEPEEEEAEPEPEPAAGDHELTDIPGIGPATAENFEDEGFAYADVVEASTDELTEVSGIGPATAEKIKQGIDELEEAEG